MVVKERAEDKNFLSMINVSRVLFIRQKLKSFKRKI
jgi:hypothetical protein